MAAAGAAPASAAGADPPDALGGPAEVIELAAGAELCLRAPRFAGDFGARVRAWRLRNASLIDDVRRNRQTARELESRLQAARRPLSGEDAGSVEVYCQRLASRFLPRAPVIVGANAPPAAAAPEPEWSVVGTWRLVSVTAFPKGVVNLPTLATYSRYYPDGRVAFWTVPPTEVRRATYRVEAGRIAVSGMAADYGLMPILTRTTLRFRDGAGGEQLHARTPTDLEPQTPGVPQDDAKNGAPLPGLTPEQIRARISPMDAYQTTDRLIAPR